MKPRWGADFRLRPIEWFDILNHGKNHHDDLSWFFMNVTIISPPITVRWWATIRFNVRQSDSLKVCWLEVDLSSSMWINNVDLHIEWCTFENLYAHEHFWIFKFEVSSKRMHLYIYFTLVACKPTSIRRLRSESPYRPGLPSSWSEIALTLARATPPLHFFLVIVMSDLLRVADP